MRMKTLALALLMSLAVLPQGAPLARQIRPGLDVYFSPHTTPEESPTAALVARMDAEQEEILCLVYSFTSTEIRDALLRAHARGVLVRIISDRTNLTGKGSVTGELQAAGIEVVYDFEHSIQHNKVAVFGRQTLATGSFNWTSAAEIRNAENLVIQADAPLAQTFAEEWGVHYTHCVKR